MKAPVGAFNKEKALVGSCSSDHFSLHCGCRIYDKEGNGYITTETLRGLISELLAPLTEEELEGILEELDEDGSGSMDFDEFCEMMMTKPE